jgi:hypothetical protein
MFKQFFLAQDFYHKHLMCKCVWNAWMWQEPNALLQLKSFKKSNFGEFWAIDRTWPTLDKFYYPQFHKLIIVNTLEAYIRFGTKLFHLTWKKGEM